MANRHHRALQRRFDERRGREHREGHQRQEETVREVDERLIGLHANEGHHDRHGQHARQSQRSDTPIHGSHQAIVSHEQQQHGERHNGEEQRASEWGFEITRPLHHRHIEVPEHVPPVHPCLRRTLVLSL